MPSKPWATLPLGTFPFSTNAWLTFPGSPMGFKVYVKLTTGPYVVEMRYEYSCMHQRLRV